MGRIMAVMPIVFLEMISTVCEHISGEINDCEMRFDERFDSYSIGLKESYVIFDSRNKEDVLLFVNGALWAISLIDEINELMRFKGKFADVDDVLISEVMDVPLYLLVRLKAGMIKNDLDKLKVKLTPLMVEEIKRSLRCSSEVPWSLSIEGVDHFAGSNCVLSEDGESIDILSDNIVDVVYGIKIKSFLKILVQIYEMMSSMPTRNCICV
jgi:hypothetical protein